MALMSLLLTSAFTLAVAWVVFKVIRAQVRARKLFVFGVPDGYCWWAGHLRVHKERKEEGLNWLHQQTRKFKRTFLVQFGPFRSVLVVAHPDTVKAVLKTSEPKDDQYNNFLGPWLGDGLLNSRGGKWARNRRLLTPAFHFSILRPYMDVNNGAADRLCDYLGAGVRGDRDGEEAALEISNPVSCSTLDVMLRCAFSMVDDELQAKGTDHPYVQKVCRVAELTQDRIFKPWLHPGWIYNFSETGKEYKQATKFLHEVSDNVIQKRKQELAANPDLLTNKKRLDFLDILLTARDADGGGLSDEDVRAEVDTFLFEGHDTTASAIMWILKELANHPDHQARCQEELDKLLGGRDNGDISWANLGEMPHTTLCIKEGMRLNSPVPFIGRQTVKEVEIDGRVVEPGTHVDIALALLHLNPDVWGQDAKEFRPERMGGQEAEARDPYAFCPFSAGPRNCIGQNFAMNEIKVTVAKVLRRFRLSPDPGRTPTRSAELVMRPHGGLYLRLSPRL